jgi:rRNA-processing protein FCF1
MKEKVIFDTNIICNKGANNFLGGRNELKNFLKDADIVIPEIVIQEIKRQKKEKLVNNRSQFFSNPLHKPSLNSSIRNCPLISFGNRVSRVCFRVWIWALFS